MPGVQSLAVHNFDANPSPDIALVGDFNEVVTLTNNTKVSATSTTTLAVAPAGAADYGQPVTLTATVSGSAGAPTGTVAFFDNGVQIGSGTLSTVGGSQQAALMTSALAV